MDKVKIIKTILWLIVGLVSVKITHDPFIAFVIVLSVYILIAFIKSLYLNK